MGGRIWGAVKNRPSPSLERTADSCAIQMGFESHCEENHLPVAHVRGCREDKCCFVALAPLFIHPQGSSVWLFRVSASSHHPRARALHGRCSAEEETPCHAATDLLQLLGGSRLLRPFAPGYDLVHCLVSCVHGKSETFGNLLYPLSVLHTPNCPSGAGHQDGINIVVWAHAGGH